MQSKGTNEDPVELIRAYLAIYDGYHRQKETMAYAATAAYLSGSAFLISQEPFWLNFSRWEFCCFFGFLIVVGFLVFFFIRWQFREREKAAEIFSACVNLSTRWLTVPPRRDELLPAPCHLRCTLGLREEWPKALAEEIQDIRKKRRRFWWWQHPRAFTYFALVVGAVAALGRVIVTKWPGFLQIFSR